jgi:excisionase family DNA binding protein
LEDHALLTVQEAAEFLRISRNSAYELVARGEVPAIRLGRTIRIPRSLLARWVLARGVDGLAQTGLAIEPRAARAALVGARSHPRGDGGDPVK